MMSLNYNTSHHKENRHLIGIGMGVHSPNSPLTDVSVEVPCIQVLPTAMQEVSVLKKSKTAGVLTEGNWS